MFAYDDKKQAYIKDPKAGTFRELVHGGRALPRARSSTPGRRSTPRRRTSKWIKRAERFN